MIDRQQKFKPIETNENYIKQEEKHLGFFFSFVFAKEQPPKRNAKNQIKRQKHRKVTGLCYFLVEIYVRKETIQSNLHYAELKNSDNELKISDKEQQHNHEKKY